MSRIELTPPLRALSAIALMLPLCGVAAPTISIDRVQQRYPWNRLVDIDYTLSGLTGDVNDYRIVFTASAVTNGVAISVVCSNFLDYAACDLPTAEGASRVTWDAAADGAGFFAKDATVAAQLVYQPVTQTDADYMIVDLSSGASSAAYPVRYVRFPRNNDFSVQFNRPRYKTTHLVLRRVEAGTFTMGNGTSGAALAHTVQLTQDYYLGLFELTRTQYLSVVGGKDPSSMKHTDTPESPTAWCPVGKLPQTTILAGDGVLARLTARATCRGEGVGSFVLPTEAQWEYACRAGTTTKYFWGTSDALAGNYAWYKDNCLGADQAVGLKLPNPWGFYDMAGNADEWCNDCYANYTDDPAYVAGGTTVDPKGVASAANAVLRGAYWTYSETRLGDLTSYIRYNAPSGSDYSNHGLRVSLTVSGAMP